MLVEFLKLHYTSIATAIFVAVILLAQGLASPPYDWTKNTISDLGAQQYPKKAIMQFGFLAFGLILAAGMLLNGLEWRNTPIFIYGLCVGMTGIFCTQPFFSVEAYATTEANWHAAFAQIAGVAFTVGILVQGYYAPNTQEKWLHGLFFLSVVALSASFGLFKDHQGVFQRLLYLISFIWLIRWY